MLLVLALAGVGLGLITGLTPGLHVNNLTPLLLAVAGSGSVDIAVAIVAMSIANVFISYIPSTFLGVPEEGTALSVLPAHRLLLEGRGHHAVKLSIFGCLGGLLLGSALLLPFLFVVGPAYELLRPNMHWLLIGVVGIMILLERSRVKVAWSLVIFFLSGLLGLFVLDGGLLSGDAALLPLLSGLFGASVLLPSILEKTSLPEQYTGEEEISPKQLSVPLFAGTAAGAVTGIIPGIGPSQGTVLAQTATRTAGTEEFLTAVSSVNTSKALFSFVALYAIGKARSGAAVAVGQLIDVGMSELILLVGVAIFAGGIAAFLGLKLSRWVAGRMDAVPYRGLCIAVIFLVTAIVLLLSGLWGVVVFGVSTAVGLLPPIVGVKRTHAMGCILLPCILYFAGVKHAVMSAMGL